VVAIVGPFQRGTPGCTLARMPTGHGCDALWLGELGALYARVDALYADWSCPTSNDCCHFGSTGRQPYVTAIELMAIRSTLAEQGSWPREPRVLLPLLREGDERRRCLLLDPQGRCSVYAQRPFGCRTYYCGRAERGARPDVEELAVLLAALQALAARHRMGGDQPRPLTNALGGGWAG
jgi:Fe-S-cluster containining protein